MPPELIAHWSEYASAARKMLLLASRNIRIFDPDLVKPGLESQENALDLRRFLSGASPTRLQIVLRNVEPFQRESPRLLKLLADFPHKVEVWECASSIKSLTDAMFLSDDEHALIRIHEDHARSRLIVGDAAACIRHRQRFDEILGEGGTPLSATTLGL